MTFNTKNLELAYQDYIHKHNNPSVGDNNKSEYQFKKVFLLLCEGNKFIS